MAEDPRMGRFEYRRVLKEQRARKELLERRGRAKARFTRATEAFRTLDELRSSPYKKVNRG